MLAVVLGSCWLVSPAGAAGKVEFARDIRPILARHCQSCHGPDEATREAKLRLDLRDEAVARKAIVPGDPKASKLITRIHSAKPGEIMPPPDSKKPLNDAQKKLLEEWISQGADYAAHWAFRPPVRPAIPAAREAARVRNPIDAFVLERLEKEGLKPAPEADKATLLRRVTLDLTGLPPTPAAVSLFLADTGPDAYEKAVDRLLASPAYGEKMAMGWLDAARFADTNGFNNDEDRTQWPWRDWVIAAFQQNMPFDRFLTEQIAGDLLPNATTAQQVATAFLRNQTHNTEGGIIQEEYRVEYVADRVHTTATVFLGLSMGCARCHDHKYDPVSQRDYYRFYAYFNSIPEKQASYSNFAAAEPYILVPSPAQQSAFDRLARERLEFERELPVREKLALAEWTDDRVPAHEIAQLLAGSVRSPVGGTVALLAKRQAPELRKPAIGLVDAQYRRIKLALNDVIKKRAELEKSFPPVMVMRDMPTPRETFVLKRGAYDQPGEKVTTGVPAAVAALPKDAPPNRLGLARWMTAPENPLTARVAVNRWWQSYFGVGLVKTVEDFGLTGEFPSHPELLDYLATELVASKWDVRAMQRLIVTSGTYRQSSQMRNPSPATSPAGVDAGANAQPRKSADDPENRLLSRGPRFRMSAEMIRDNALAVSGLLKTQVGGPSVKPYQPGGLWEDVSVSRRAVYQADTGDGLYRRTMYTFWKRTCPPPTLATFDAPNREVCVARRAVTNTPLQALILLNDPTYVEAGRKLAERMMKAGPAPAERLDAGYRYAVARPATEAERAILTGMHADALARFTKEPAAARGFLGVGASPRDPSLNEIELAAWSVVAGAILNLDETISKR